MTDITKLKFLSGTLREDKQGTYDYIQLLKQGLTNLGVTYPSGGGGGGGTLEQTLLLGNITDEKIIWQDTGDGIVTAEYIPSNNGTVYPGYGEASYFSQGWGRFNGVNASGRPNVVGTFWGYNHNMGGGRWDLGEASFGFRTETHFEVGPLELFEFHLPEFTDETGVSRRLFSFYVDKTGATPTGAQMAGVGIQWSQWTDGANTWGKLSPSDLFLYNYESVAGTKITLGSKTWVAGDSFVISPVTFEQTNIGRINPTSTALAVIAFSDNVTIGDPTSSATNRRSRVYGFHLIDNKFDWPAFEVKQRSASVALIAGFYDGDTEVVKINKLGVDLKVYGDYVDDAAAATGGVPVTGIYRTGSVLKVRVS